MKLFFKTRRRAAGSTNSTAKRANAVLKDKFINYRQIKGWMMFTKISTVALLAAALSACQSPALRVGNDADAHGCRASAGETFSQLQ